MSSKKDNNKQQVRDRKAEFISNLPKARTTPYSDEQLHKFAISYLEMLEDTKPIKDLVRDRGREGAIEIIKTNLKKEYSSNLENIIISKTKH